MTAQGFSVSSSCINRTIKDNEILVLLFVRDSSGCCLSIVDTKKCTAFFVRTLGVLIISALQYFNSNYSRKLGESIKSNEKKKVNSPPSHVTAVNILSTQAWSFNFCPFHFPLNHTIPYYSLALYPNFLPDYLVLE